MRSLYDLEQTPLEAYPPWRAFWEKTRKDFTSALYLGMIHPSPSLGAWRQLTAGRPSALGTPGRSLRLAAGLADLTGARQAVLGPSTLHLFWDLFDILSEEPITIFIDRAAYPIARWSTACAVAKGVTVHSFSHLDAGALEKRMAGRKVQGYRPVVVTDGFCPACGKAAPISAYLDMVNPGNGWLVIDDTQALGIFGCRPDQRNPYGSGGGGSLRLQRVHDPRIILVSSLAKAFGAPLAMLAGSRRLVRRFRDGSRTRVHCSPPSAADISAAERALAVNASHGNTLRRRLAQLVQLFRAQMDCFKTLSPGRLFPVQTLAARAVKSPAKLYNRLMALGLRTVLHRHCRDRRPRISFVLTTRHEAADIMRAGRILAAIAADSSIREERNEVRLCIMN